MLALLLAITEKEPNKTAFYIAGFILVIWAGGLTFYGMREAKWPSSLGGQRGVVVLSIVLVAATMVAAVATS
jgi:hypothetical protein